MNARSVRNKSDDLRELVIDNTIDIFCLTETWLAEADSAVVASLLPDTHNIFHFPRTFGSGGGVGAIVSKIFQNVKAFNRARCTFECMELHLQHNSKNIVISVFYRPPNTNLDDFFREFEEHVLENETKNTENAYVGDFNIWMDDTENSNTQRLMTLLNNFRLQNIVDVATYGSGHILDLVIVRKNSGLLKNPIVDPPGLISDHSLIHLKMSTAKCPRNEKIISFRLNNEDFSRKVTDELNACMFTQEITCTHNQNPCINCLVSVFRRKTQEIFDEMCPIVRKCIPVRDATENWFNAEIRDAKRKMRKAEKDYMKHRTESYLLEFRTKRQIKCRLVAQSKKEYFKRKIYECRNDPRKLFDQLRILLGQKNSSVTLPRYSSKQVLADDFQKFFVDKIDNIVASFGTNSVSNFFLYPDFPIKALKCFLPITPEKTLNIMRSMNKTYSNNDTMSIKKVDMDNDGHNFAIILSEIINSSFHDGIFPNQEKFAFIRPLVKKGLDPDLLSSYRPIYNTSFLSKLLEKSALEQLLSHVNRFECIPSFQSAYREFHSVESALCRVYNDLIKNKANGGCSILILLDLSAAFDTIDIPLLLNDLEKNFGIEDEALSWIRSFLMGRNFSVLIDEVVSVEGSMKFGVPQGTILGPFLFTVYISSLQYLLDRHGVSYHFYADDTQVYFNVENKTCSTTKINELSISIQNWMNDRRLKLNAGKTEVMVIGSRSKILNLDLGSEIAFGSSIIPVSHSARNLGVILDENLTMRNQLNSARRKAIGGLINISKISGYIDKGCRMKLVHSLVLSQIDFCNSLYYDLPARDINSLQMLQNSAARVIHRMPRFSRDRITPICIDLHFLPVRARIEYKICLLTFKALKFKSPAYLSDLLRESVLETSLELRSAGTGRLREPFLSRSATVNRCFEHCAPRLFNSLPPALRMETSVEAFKHKLKTYLFEKSYDLQNMNIDVMYRA